MKKTPQLPEVRRNEDGMLMSTREEVDARVAYIEGLMLRGEFKRGITARELSKEWGIDLKTVQRYASLASRLCWDDSDEEREELRSQSIVKLMAIAEQAHEKGKLKDATGAIKVANEVAGTLRAGPAVMVNTQINNNRPTELPQWARDKLSVLAPEQIKALQAGCELYAAPSYAEMMAEYEEFGEVLRAMRPVFENS